MLQQLFEKEITQSEITKHTQACLHNSRAFLPDTTVLLNRNTQKCMCWHVYC